MKKRNMIIATSILVATLSVGGTTYAVNKNHANKVNDAKLELRDEIVALKSISSELASYIDKDGYLHEGLTFKKVKKLKESLNSIKDDYSDFSIKKDDLKNEIKVVKSDRKILEKEIAVIESKLLIQNEVNGLFANAVITGTRVTVQPIKDDVTLDKVNAVKVKIEKVDSNWGIELNKLILEAESQLKQIETANNKVKVLFTGGIVNPNVTIIAYNESKAEVDKILVEKTKFELKNKLNEVLIVAEANQKKAEEDRLKAEQEALAHQQSQQVQTKASQSNETNSSGASTGGKSVSSNTTSKANGSSTGSKSSGSSTTNSGGTSSGGLQEGQVGNVETTGGGVITNHDGSEENGSSTWTGGKAEWGGW